MTQSVPNIQIKTNRLCFRSPFTSEHLVAAEQRRVSGDVQRPRRTAKGGGWGGLISQTSLHVIFLRLSERNIFHCPWRHIGFLTFLQCKLIFISKHQSEHNIAWGGGLGQTSDFLMGRRSLHHLESISSHFLGRWWPTEPWSAPRFLSAKRLFFLAIGAKYSLVGECYVEVL